MDPASGVIVAQTAAGTSVVLGLMRCGRIWLCPVCAAVIRHRRAEEITQAVVTWLQQGGTAYLVTFTARHAYKDALA
ncbi:replication protein, partial [Streptomyces microflavus]